MLKPSGLCRRRCGSNCTRWRCIRATACLYQRDWAVPSHIWQEGHGARQKAIEAKVRYQTSLRSWRGKARPEEVHRNHERVAICWAHEGILHVFSDHMHQGIASHLQDTEEGKGILVIIYNRYAVHTKASQCCLGTDTYRVLLNLAACETGKRANEKPRKCMPLTCNQ